MQKVPLNIQPLRYLVGTAEAFSSHILYVKYPLNILSKLKNTKTYRQKSNKFWVPYSIYNLVQNFMLINNNIET